MAVTSTMTTSTVSSATNDLLFTPLKLDDGLTLANRIVHAPVTRARSTLDHVPTELNAQYYEQRADAGLIITEACAISEQGFGWFATPALYTDKHEAGWRMVVERVHARGGKIYLQLWHMGRQAHSSFNSKHEVVSASASRYAGGRTRDANGKHTAYETARALRTDEIRDIIEDYHRCAERAKDAGFDGVELHAGSGYLIDQFLQAGTNHRTDIYGGSFDNRSRLLLEVVDALATVFPSSRVGVRFNLNHSTGGMGTEDNSELFIFAIQRLATRRIGYVALLEAIGHGIITESRVLTSADVKRAFGGGVVMTAVDYDRESAEDTLCRGDADLVAFGTWFMANPDLVNRFRLRLPLKPKVEYKYWFDHTMGAIGYTLLPGVASERGSVKPRGTGQQDDATLVSAP